MPTQIQERIRVALRSVRMSQAALARFCKVSKQLVTFWLHEDPDKRLVPDDEQLQCIAEATGVSVEWLKGLRSSGGPRPTANDTPPQVSERASRHKHSRRAIFDRAIRDAIRDLDPQLIDCFGKRLHLRHLDSRMWFDFVGQQVVADVCFVQEMGPASVTNCRARLWQLSVLRQLERDFGITRHYCLMLVPLPVGDAATRMTDAERTVQIIKLEAGVLGLDVQVATTPQEAARLLVAAERQS